MRNPSSRAAISSSTAVAFTLALSVVAAGAIGCGESKSGPQTCGVNAAGYAPDIVAANFPTSTKIDNKYFPLVPGTVSVFKDGDGNVTEVTVTSETKVIAGITCVVVHDSAKTATGEVEEDTFDWFAQDKDGNVWYFGEDTKAYQAGKPVSAQGSWQTGVSCALPGIAMKGTPAVGDSYRQEYRAGTAEDRADVLSVTESVTVPYGTFTGCLKTKDYTDLEPGAAENKVYCPGVGEVTALEVLPVAGKHEDLVTVNGMIRDAGSP